MMTYIHNVNAYVEASKRYGADKLMLKLDEGTLTVTVELVDVYGTVIAGAPKLVDEPFTDLKKAIKFYEEMAHQLAQGDVIRNYNLAQHTRRNPYDNDGNRYPSF